jgi:hypothetical protein
MIYICILDKTDKIIHTKKKKQTYRSRTNKNPQDHKTGKVKMRVISTHQLTM